jgi:hypothetical protein
MCCKYVDPRESKIENSICGEAGNNKRTCEARKVGAETVAKKGSNVAMLVQLDKVGSTHLL